MFLPGGPDARHRLHDATDGCAGAFPRAIGGRGFHTARSAIYQLFTHLVASGRTRAGSRLPHGQ